MKTIDLFYILSAAILISACEKLPYDNPDVNIVAGALEVKAGETVKFNLEGDADFISVFTGETGCQYQNRTEKSIDIKGSDIKLSFTSNLPTVGSLPIDVKVMASVDFDGNYDDFRGVEDATWTDISARFKFPAKNANVASTEKSIAEVVAVGKPLFIAFRATFEAMQDEKNNNSSFAVSALTISSVSQKFGTQVIAGIGNQNTGFRIVDQRQDDIVEQSASAVDPKNTNILLQSASLPTKQSQVWAISKPLNVESLTVQPDVPMVLKTVEDPSPSSFEHVYDIPGDYKVVFILKNARSSKEKTIVKEFTITVTNPDIS